MTDVEWAGCVGDDCRAVVDQLLEVNALYRLRAAKGILGLRKKYGDTRLEAACTKAITVGDPSYRTIKPRCAPPGPGSVPS
ncbi:hypothetical protein ACFT7S_13560 [Streptomyces sp. NPDC057136]|uniref:hypothetical protein n=1 Tax=Streptomyces sp. NPDC057136 TaxID=3346029 RepID=UPI00363402DF